MVHVVDRGYRYRASWHSAFILQEGLRQDKQAAAKILASFEATKPLGRRERHELKGKAKAKKETFILSR